MVLILKPRLVHLQRKEHNMYKLLVQFYISLNGGYSQSSKLKVNCDKYRREVDKQIKEMQKKHLPTLKRKVNDLVQTCLTTSGKLVNIPTRTYGMPKIRICLLEILRDKHKI